jgi:hypothetical protein
MGSDEGVDVDGGYRVHRWSTGDSATAECENCGLEAKNFVGVPIPSCEGGRKWKARALAAEHSAKVLMAQLEALRYNTSEIETLWDRYAAAAAPCREMEFCDDWNDWAQKKAEHCAMFANEMMQRRKERFG